MTFSILAYDRKTGTYAAAAATGSLCVGGWVLRGDIEAGLVASQGTAPSTFWRDDTIRLMRQGQSAADSVAQVTRDDPGRGHRQLTALDLEGRGAGFTGPDSVAVAAHQCGDGLVVAGNMLASLEVLNAFASRFRSGEGEAIEDRLLASLRAAEAEGGDARGLLSAAILVLRPTAPPLDLRIDHSGTPIDDLAKLVDAASKSPYADWLHEVPVLSDRGRAPR